MKHMKKMMALVITLVMVLGMTVAVFATDTGIDSPTGDETPTAETGHTISVSNGDTHTYRVFQVLTGTLANEGSKQLGNPQWGADAIEDPGDVETFITSITAPGKTEQEIATLVAAKVKMTGNGRGTVSKDNPLNNLATGYYVLVDVTEIAATHDGKIDTKALHVVQVLNDINGIAIKYGTTEDKKVISSDTLGKDEGANTYEPGETQDNVSIGDTVNYTITAKVPDNADKFKPGTFFFVITDKLSEGLTFTDGSIKVYDGDTELQPGEDGKPKYTVQYNVNGNTFEIGLINAAGYAGKNIKVTYSAVLNENAVIGDAGNPNTSTVKFSNDPNKIYDGSPEDSTHPGFPDSTKEVPTGVTPESTTITYTTGIEIQKVDENGEPLAGVTFELSGQSAKKVVTKTESFEVDNEKGTYYKLKDGTYTMTPPTTENTMVPAENGATKGYVEDADASGEDVIIIGEKKYRPYVPETDTGKTLYILQIGSADAYADTSKYKKTVAQKTIDSEVTDHKMSETVDANGLVRFDGLGAGTYTIKETGTPAGYNTVADSTVEVTFNEKGEAKFEVVGGVYEDGIIKLKVVNKKGMELPETGGMGTQMFYIFGVILVLSAGVLLVVRRRANA